MKTGLTLSQLAAKVEGNKELKHDLITPSRGLQMRIDSDGTTPLMHVSNENAGKGADYPMLALAHDQIGSHLGMPAKYYDRMLAEAPALLADNVNTWLRRRPENERRMVRTLGGDVRAFLSNAYQRIENEEIAEVVLPILADIPGVQIVSAEITEHRMYIQATTPETRAVKVGDEVRAGVIISNSEVGQGAVSISPMVYRLVCLNGMVCADGRFRGYHVGRRIEDSEALYADDTKRADDRAVLLKVRDHVKAAVDAVRFRARVEQMSGLTEIQISGNPEKAVEVLAKKIGASEGERTGILRSLIEGGSLSAWAMLNAVTAQAHTPDMSYDRAVEFETMGGQLLDLPRSGWREVLEAA